MTGALSFACAAILVLFLYAGPAFAQTGTAPVSNRTRKTCVSVRDPQGLPVAAVAVSLEPQAAAAVQRGGTDATGRWCTNAALGTYIVRAVGRGMEGASRALTIQPGEGEQEVDLPLEISSLASQVQVTASRLPESLLESPLPIRQIDTRQLTAIGARQLNDALQEMPEVITFAGGSHSGGGSANVQGFSSRDVEILIDGQPLTGRVSGYVDLNQFDASIIEAVEVKTGASAMTYGLQGMGGAINLVTKRATAGTHSSFEAGYGRFNTGLLRADGGYARGGFALYGAASMQRGLGYDLDPSTLGMTQPANRVRNLFSSLYLPHWKNWNVGMSALFTDQSFWGADSSQSTGVYDFHRPKRRLALLPRATYTLTPNSVLNFRGRKMYYRSNEDLTYRSPFNLRVQKTENFANGGDADWTISQPGGLRLSTGVFFNRLSMFGDRLSTTGNTATTDVWSQLTTAEIPLSGTLRLLAGYRADRDRVFGGRFSPQAALSWRPLRWVSVAGGVTRGIRAPDFNEMYIFYTHAGGRVRIYGEPSLMPQQSWSSHASALFRFGTRTRLETQWFYHDMSDLIQTQFVGREGIASVFRYRNVGKAMIRGGSTSISVTPSRRLELMAGYQYLDTLNRVASTLLEYAPRHRGNFRLTYAERRLGLLASFFGNITSRTYFGLSGANRVYMNGFELIGANIQKEITRRVGLRLTLRNLTNNVDPAYRLTAPVSVESALRIQLGRVE